jgi:hypothetical protein
LTSYAYALRDVIQSSGGGSALASKFEELTPVMEAFKIQLDENVGEIFEKRPPEYFTTINNDLRKMAVMIDLGTVGKEIRRFVEGLPTSMFQVNVLARSGFGIGENPQGMIAVLTANYEQAPHPISQLKNFHDILFVLLSGQTLVLQTDKNFRAGQSLAKRLAVLSPFERPFTYATVEGGGLGILKYPIVIVHDVECPGVPIFNIDDSTYKGDTCPQDSVLQQVVKYPNEKENYTIICATNNVKRIYSKFRIKIAEATTRPLHTRDDMLKILIAMGFSQSDIPLFKYWMTCLASTQHARPILLDHFNPHPAALS